MVFAALAGGFTVLSAAPALVFGAAPGSNSLPHRRQSNKFADLLPTNYVMYIIHS